MNKVRNYQQHVQCSPGRDLYFLSSVPVEDSEYLFGAVTPESPSLNIDVENSIPVQAYAIYTQFVTDICRFGEFSCDNSGAEIRIPDESDLRVTFSSSKDSVYKFVGLRILPEQLSFALLDCEQYHVFQTMLRDSDDPDNDSEIPPNYGIWLNVPIKGLTQYDLHIVNGADVLIRPRPDFVEIVEEEKYIRHYASQKVMICVDKTIRNICRIRDERGRAVVNIKEIRQAYPAPPIPV